VRRVAADQQLAQFVHGGLDRGRAALDHRFAPDADALVGLDLQEQPARRRVPGGQARNLHAECSRHAARKRRAFARVCAGAWPGRYSSPPIAAPLHPAARYSPMLSGVMPPTASSGTGGSTLRRARTSGGPYTDAGNSLTMCAPASSASKASLAVAQPAAMVSPRSCACRISAGRTLGVTTRRPPDACNASRWAGSSTVPAPTSARSPQAATAIATLRAHSGELVGISIAPMPASSSTSTCAAASVGVMPRRIAISGGSKGGWGSSMALEGAPMVAAMLHPLVMEQRSRGGGRPASFHVALSLRT